jgi:hypothetical protein
MKAVKIIDSTDLSANPKWVKNGLMIWSAALRKNPTDPVVRENYSQFVQWDRALRDKEDERLRDQVDGLGIKSTTAEPDDVGIQFPMELESLRAHDLIEASYVNENLIGSMSSGGHLKIQSGKNTVDVYYDEDVAIGDDNRPVHGDTVGDFEVHFGNRRKVFHHGPGAGQKEAMAREVEKWLATNFLFYL